MLTKRMHLRKALRPMLLFWVGRQTHRKKGHKTSFWSFAAITITSGFPRLLNLTIIAVIVLIYCDNARFHNSNPWYVLGFPFAVLLFIYILWRSTIIALRNDGIRWRGTHYPLSRLKANRV